MPDRIVREGINSSEAIDKLDWPAEVLYRRLINEHDDFGRFDARPFYLRSRLYPLRLDRVREADVTRWLAACQSAGAVALYEYEGKPYGVVLKVRGRPRARHSKYPQPPAGIQCWRGSGEAVEVGAQERADDNVCAHLRADARTCAHVRPYSNASSNPNPSAKAKARARASSARVGNPATGPPASDGHLPFEDEIRAKARRLASVPIEECVQREEPSS